MRLNRLFCGILTVFCVFFPACERSDLLSGAGESVVAGTDSTLTDMHGGFAMLNLGPDAVAEAFSLPRAADPAFSTQSLEYLLIGINRDGDTLAAHMQYRVTPFGADPIYTEADNHSTTAYLYFRAADSKGASDVPITVFPSDTLIGLTPVNRGDKVITADELGSAVTTDNRIDAFDWKDSENRLDSIRLPSAIAEQIFNTRTSGDTTAAFAFAFSIVDYKGEFRKIQNPYVVLHVTKKNSPVVRDSILGYTRFTAFESNAGVKSRHPYSSQHALRTAVFKIDISKIISDLEIRYGGAKSELVNAVLAISPNRNSAAEADSGGPALASDSAIGYYRILILDTLLQNEHPADTAAYQNSLRWRFLSASSTEPREPFNTHGIKPLLRSVTGSQDGSGKGPYIFVYLRAAADGMILWDKNDKEKLPRVETVFTPLRSQ